MKLSTKGRYGLKAMLDLAVHSCDGEQVVLKNIAERQELSENYLEQLFAKLKKAKIVISTRGSQGGYILGRSASEITVGDILRTLEGPLAPVVCISESKDKVCSNYDCCVTRGVWEKIHSSVNNVIDSTTLQDLVDEYNENLKKR